MKVLYVSHTSLVSGAEGALLDLLAAVSRTIETQLACPPGPLSDRARALGVSVTDLPPVSGSFRVDMAQLAAVARMLAAAAALRRVIAKLAPDIVHANTTRAGLVCAAALTRRSTPLVVHCHDVLPASRQADIVRAVLRRASAAMVTISDYTADRLADGRPGAPLHVLYNPLDVARFDPARISRAAARRSLGFDHDDLLLGLFAQITPWKGHECAIRALGRLVQESPRVRLLVVGEAKFTSRETRFDNLAFLARLRELISELGLEAHVEFLGQRTDVEVLMRAVDVALTPSWEEPFGRSVIEAMAMETPVVATTIGGPSEYVIDGVDGLLAPPQDTEAWARAIGSLLESPRWRSELGMRASAAVRLRFDRNAYAARMIKVYEPLVRGRCAPLDQLLSGDGASDSDAPAFASSDSSP